MAEAAGFWSYVHADDEQDGQRITLLASLLRAEYELLTGESLEIFVDVALDWGDDWRSRIEEALAVTTFFIPIVTPRFFHSEECRRELVRYMSAAKSQGLEELVLPILYIEVPGLRDPVVADEAMALIAAREWADWTRLRLIDRDSADHRQAVNGLAERLLEISQRVEATPTGQSYGSGTEEGSQEDVDSSEDGEAPGYLELFAVAEETMPQLARTIESLGPAIELLGTTAESHTKQLEELSHDASAQVRLAAVRKLGRDLDTPAEEVKALGTEYASQLVALNPAILAFFRTMEEDDAVASEESRQFFESISSMAPASRRAGDSLRELIGAMAPIARWSRDLRRPLKTVEAGLRSILDAQGILDEWESQAGKWLDL